MSRSIGWLSTEVSGIPIGPIFKGQVSWIGSAETSVLNEPALRNIPEDDRNLPIHHF